MAQANPNINFNEIEEYLDTIFKNDEKARNIVSKAGFTEMQIGIINILIVGALKSYHLRLFPPTFKI